MIARLAAASVDDVAAGASRASVKAAGVIVDDAAVTPRYVQGFEPERELPMIRRIATGSLRNKLLFILPAAHRVVSVRGAAAGLCTSASLSRLRGSAWKGGRRHHHRPNG